MAVNPLFLNTFTGIGLFLIGVRLLTLHMQQVGQQRLRLVLSSLGGSGWRLRLLGLVAGAGFQSVNALIQVVVALVHADTLSMRQGFQLVAWANLGTSFLVLVATFNYLHPLALGLIGITGVLFYVRLDRSARWGHAVGVLLALGLLFLGIDFIKAGSAGVRADPRLAQALQAMDAWPWGAWALGVLASFVAQSSLTITLVVMAIVGGGAMGLGTAGMVVLGTGLGSALSTWFLVGHLERSARQLAMYQLLFRASGSVVLALAWWAALSLGWVSNGADPDVMHEVLAALFVGHYLVSLLVLGALNEPLTQALARRWPPAPETLWRQPRYIHAGALQQPVWGLDLLLREHQRLLTELPDGLSAWRNEQSQSPEWVAQRLDGLRQVLKASDAFAEGLMAQVPEAAVAHRLLEARNRHALLRGLIDTLDDMAALVSPGAASAFIMQVHPLAEGLHALLTLLAEQEAAPDALTAQWLLGLSQDRVADLQAFRQGLRNLVLEEGVLSALLDAASLHQRGVWLVRQWLLHSAEVWGLDVEQAA